jgi:spore germination protein
MGFFQNWLRGSPAFSTQEQADQILNDTISSSIPSNLYHLSKLFSGIPDLITRDFSLKNGEKALIVYMDGLVDKTIINKNILRPLLFKELIEQDSWESIIPVAQIKKVQEWKEIEKALLNGKSLLFIDGQLKALEIETQGWPQRQVQEPITETSLKSSHQGFTETASQSIALIRRYIPSRELKVKEFDIGERASAKLSVLYLADIANNDLIQELENRIQSLKVDTILNTGSLQELLEDKWYSPFPQLGLTERPDTVAHKLLEGRIAVVVDRSPGVLIGPMNFPTFFKTIDDYSLRSIVASFVRIMRFIGFFISVFAPALYIAMISFHYEVLPLKLLLTIGASRERIPFPPILEALLMELVLEMLREAAIRLPAPIGQTIGVVGGIVVGQAAVQAGIVSNIMVIVVAITAIASFIIPDVEMASSVRLLRFPMMILSSMFGMIGIIVGMAILLIHLLSLESLGNPYSSPISPMFISEMKDTLVRFPLKFINKRPISVQPKQLKRQGNAKESEEDE